MAFGPHWLFGSIRNPMNWWRVRKLLQTFIDWESRCIINLVILHLLLLTLVRVYEVNSVILVASFWSRYLIGQIDLMLHTRDIRSCIGYDWIFGEELRFSLSLPFCPADLVESSASYFPLQKFRWERFSLNDFTKTKHRYSESQRAVDISLRKFQPRTHSRCRRWTKNLYPASVWVCEKSAFEIATAKRIFNR